MDVLTDGRINAAEGMGVSAVLRGVSLAGTDVGVSDVSGVLTGVSLAGTGTGSAGVNGASEWVSTHEPL
jgi:hypothetical protein